jgi:hypothetical protein
MKDIKIRRNYPETMFCDCRELKLTAKEKAGIVADWERFIVWRVNASDSALDQLPGSDYGICGPSQWTNRLYHAFEGKFGYIAHYNKHGFFSTRMWEEQEFTRMLWEAATQCRQHYNTWGAHHDQHDLNEAMGAVADGYYGTWEARVAARAAARASAERQQQIRELEAAGYTVTR